MNSSADKLKELIIKAIDDHKLTREEYDTIIHLASEDGVIDKHERILLEQLHDMIENRSVRFVPK